MEKQWYIFTFGVGTIHRNKYRRIFGSLEGSRTAMLALHGRHWAFQYTSDKFEEKFNHFHYEKLGEDVFADE